MLRLLFLLVVLLWTVQVVVLGYSLKEPEPLESQVPDKSLSMPQQSDPASDNSAKNFMEGIGKRGDYDDVEFKGDTRSTPTYKTSEFYDGTKGQRQAIQPAGNTNDTAVNNSNTANGTVNSTGSNTTLYPGQQQPINNTTIPVHESVSDGVPMEMKTTNDGILISYPSTFGGNVQIALEDPATDPHVDDFHPLWFLRPFVKKITNAISFLSHPNTPLTPAHIFKKIRDKTLHTLRETYKKICGGDNDDNFEYKHN